MDRKIWALSIREIIWAVDNLQTHLIINNEDPAIHTLCEHWHHVLTLLYRQKTGEDYDAMNPTATH